MNNSVIKLLICRGILCGLVSLSSMIFGMNGVIVQKPIQTANESYFLRINSLNHYLNNREVDTPIQPVQGATVSLRDTIGACLVKNGPGDYHFLAPALFVDNGPAVQTPYNKDPKFQFPLADFLDRSFDELTGLKRENKAFALLVRDPSGKEGNYLTDFPDRYFKITQVIDNSKKSIMFYCKIGISAFVFIGAILFYLGKLPQF